MQVPTVEEAVRALCVRPVPTPPLLSYPCSSTLLFDFLGIYFILITFWLWFALLLSHPWRLSSTAIVAGPQDQGSFILPPCLSFFVVLALSHFRILPLKLGPHQQQAVSIAGTEHSNKGTDTAHKRVYSAGRKTSETPPGCNRPAVAVTSTSTVTDKAKATTTATATANGTVRCLT